MSENNALVRSFGWRGTSNILCLVTCLSAPAALADEASLTIREETLTRYAQAVDISGSGTANLSMTAVCFGTKPSKLDPFTLSKNLRTGALQPRKSSSLEGLASLEAKIEPSNRLEVDRPARAADLPLTLLGKCNSTVPVAYSWTVKRISADITASGIAFSGYIELTAQSRVRLIPFTLDATASYEAGPRQLRLLVSNAPIELKANVLGGERVLGRARLRNHLSTRFLLGGSIQRPGPDLVLSGTDVSVELRPGAIRISGDIEM